VSLDGQADYLVRQWLVFISLGVSKFVWYNAPFADGFSLWEKDGPAPWPAAMALTQLIRFADHADYVGNYEADPGVWFVVFRNRENDRLQAAVWKPVYLARSCEKEKNLTADGQYTEASGLAQVNFTYLTPYIADDYQVVDIMGNPEETKEGAITIGERPVYVYGLTEDILPKLSDNRVFKTAKPRARPAPSPVILGFSDKNPVKKGEFITSVFRPGETREYELRIHNFGEETLEDTVILESDGGFEFSVPSTPGNGISGFTLKIPIAAPPGLTAKIPVKVTCPVLSEKNECKNSARLSSGKAHPVYQLVGITWPVSVVSVYKPLVAGDCLTLLLQNASPEPRTFEISVSHEHISFEVSRQTATVPAGEKAEITFMIKSVLLPFDPLLTVKISSGNITALYRPEIPVAYINEFPEVTERDLANAQKRLISHPDSIQMASDSYDGPSLIGNAKPVPLLSYGQFLLDEIHLHARFEVFDDTVVCVKNTRRNNADCDGVWLAVYASPEEKKANRFFAAVPANAAGNPEGAYLNEIRDGILFAKPFTDYDFSKISLRSEIFPDKYILTFAIDRQSVGIPPGAQSVTLYVRVLDMNHDDWTRMYDTGKTVYHIAQTT
ncbi:MAG: hypothetical protein LBQ48_01490, partial [Oscillospiraceae bacterium]|nr:hypothetical protein [Oscillospiraceae bacterium]